MSVETIEIEPRYKGYCLFENGAEKPITNISKSYNGTVRQFYVDGQWVENCGQPVYAIGVKDALDSIKDYNIHELMEQINALYGTEEASCEYWLDRQFNPENIDDVRELAHMQLLKDFSTSVFNETDDQRQKIMLKLLK